MPRGFAAPDEARLDTFGPAALPRPDVWPLLRSWWLAHDRGANTPNWDLAVTCEIDGIPGLVLVEAKANVPELSAAGKSLDAAASPASVANHERIALAIQEACTALRKESERTALSRDSHYQLSNRIAFAWKLASLGVPTVLLYLGFCGDTGIVDAGAPFEDAAHWQVCFAAYSNSIVPAGLLERRIDCGLAPAWFLVRARTVLEVSSPRLANTVIEPSAQLESRASRALGRQ
jgi:hypothetical protein